MILRILSESFIRRKRRKIIGILTIALGSSLATALIGTLIHIQDKMVQELKVYGSNILIRPKAAELNGETGPIAGDIFLKESSLVKIKNIFWTNNIVGFIPFFSTWGIVDGHRIKLEGAWFEKTLNIEEGQPWTASIEKVFPYWKVEGQWPTSQEVLAGATLAKQLGMDVGKKFILNRDGREWTLHISGILTTGDEWDEALLVDLDLVQEIANSPEAVHRVYVSALTSPENELEKSYFRNPKSLSLQEYERWACTPYLSTIMSQIHSEIPESVVEPIFEVAKREGVLLSKLKGLFLYICMIALLTSGIGVGSTLMATVAERRQEVGLLRALGAGPLAITSIFLAELAVMAVIGSVLGAVLGYGLGQMISYQIFETFVNINPVVVFVVAVVTLIISALGGILPIRSALRLDPVIVLHEV